MNLIDRIKAKKHIIVKSVAMGEYNRAIDDVLGILEPLLSPNQAGTWLVKHSEGYSIHCIKSSDINKEYDSSGEWVLLEAKDV